jgi:hypothetical protein
MYRSIRTGLAIGAGLLTAGALTLTEASPARATAGTSPYGATFTNIAPAKVGAGLAKQVITLTGTNFNEAQITRIDLRVSGAITDCQDVPYVVTSATTISIKTPTGGCAATADPTAPETVTITEVGGNTLTKQGLTFLAPPDLATTNPVVTENSSALLSANQVATLLPAGGQTIRVRAAAGYAFDGKLTGTSALSATLGGKTLSNIKVYNSEGVLQGTSAAAVGNYFTATTPSLLAGGSHSLIIMQAGVTRTFLTTTTGLSWPAVQTVSSLDPKSGKSKGGTSVRITGTGFPTVLTDAQDATKWKVQFCGIDATVSATTATLLTVVTPDTSVASPGLGVGVFEGVCPVRVVDVTNTLTSALTTGSAYAYLVN